ncbi:MAG: type II toxin-antitoxin system HicA family toxin [Bryobacteraceae bacterium]
MAFTIKLRDLIAFLADHGWEYRNTEGDHHHCIHPARKGKGTVVGERGDDVTAGLVNSILRQAGLTRKELREWLSR